MTAMTHPAVPNHAARSNRWWREPMMWLVIGGPVAVVVAGFVTLGIAIRNPDPVVPDTAVQRVPAEGTVTAGPARDTALMPAVQARNQGAAPTRPAP